MRFRSDKQRKAVMSQLNPNNSSTSKLSKMKQVKADRNENWKQKETFTEKDVLLVKRRLNDGKIKNQSEIFGDGVEFKNKKLTPEQQKKGYDYILDQRQTPKGVERKNNPFRYRENQIIDNYDRIELKEYHDISKYGQRPYYVPLYQMYSKDGDSMEYYVDSNGVNIVG